MQCGGIVVAVPMEEEEEEEEGHHFASGEEQEQEGIFMGLYFFSTGFSSPLEEKITQVWRHLKR